MKLVAHSTHTTVLYNAETDMINPIFLDIWRVSLGGETLILINFFFF